MAESVKTFTAEDALRSRWSPAAKARAQRWLVGGGLLCAVLTGGLGWLAGRLSGGAYAAALIGLLLALLGTFAGLGAAVVIQLGPAIGRLLFKFAPAIFLVALLGVVALAWAPALLYEQVDSIAPGHTGPLGIGDFVKYLENVAFRDLPGAARLAVVAAYALWPLQFQVTRDVLAMVGVVGFVSLFAMFAIWWERKVAGRIQSRLGPMRVGGWHGWAQSLADGLKLIQKEDIFLAGADRPLFKLAPYVAFAPALCLFLALPFSAAWVCRDLDVGLLFILAMIGVGVLGVLLAGWASNNKWSMLGAMREACQMISYEIPLGFALLVPVMTAGTLRLTAIGQAQAGGFHTWLAFANPFTLAAAVIFFIATLASCKRAPFDLPEAESELVAGYHTEYSGFRWALFFFAEYAEMFAVGALATLLFFGGWHSPLPASWGADWAQGALWQRALHGLLFGGPLWFIAKGLFFVYVQVWLRWTLPRVRLDQVMHACVQVLLPLTMLVLLGNTLWELLVRDGGWLAVAANVACTAVGAVFAVGILGAIVYGYKNRRRLVGSLAVDHLPGA